MAKKKHAKAISSEAELTEHRTKTGDIRTAGTTADNENAKDENTSHSKNEDKNSKGNRNYRAIAEHLIFMAMRIALLCVIGVFFYLGMNKAYILGYHVFSAYPATTGEKETVLCEDIIIIEGQSAFKIGESLEKDGIIIDGIAFGIQSMLYELEPIPGTYTVSSDMSAKEILKLISSENKEEESTTP